MRFAADRMLGRLARWLRIIGQDAIRGDRFGAQLKQVVEECRLDLFAGLLPRCVRCNEPLRSVPGDQVRDTVPPCVFETQDVFSACPACRRVFWSATHPQQMIAALERPGFIRLEMEQALC